jgi:hypothetical protein
MNLAACRAALISSNAGKKHNLAKLKSSSLIIVPLMVSVQLLWAFVFYINLIVHFLRGNNLHNLFSLQFFACKNKQIKTLNNIILSLKMGTKQ